MRVTFKLFATLGAHLPPDARRLGQASVDAPPGTTVLDLVERFRVPPGQCTLVLVNGAFVRPGEMGARVLQEGDVLAIWPPVGGG
jgi:sulfur carrier protein ThiS